MRAALALLLLVAAVHAEHRGKAYVRDKVCREFQMLGKEDFRTLTIIAKSRKFSNATFEEIDHLVREIVSLAETCCADGADPSCYDAGSSALSAKSCSESSPFPAHPGTADCCAHEGLEQKLCLAALRHPPQQLPRYVQPSNEELCQAFKKDPKDFADRFLHEYASSYGQAPLPVLLGSTRAFLSMVSTCCISPKPTACFLKEKLERKTLSLLTLTSNRVCSRFTAYGKDKVIFSYLTSLAQKIPGASFEDLLPLAEDAAEVFSQCCDSVAEDCMQRKLSEHTAKACGVLSARDERFAECCKGKNLVQNHFCISALPPAPAPELPEAQKPTDKQLCGEEGARNAKRYLFELARRHTSVPDAFLSKLYDASQKVREECCSAKDTSACLGSKRQQMGKKLPPILEKANQFCRQYTELNFLDFKKRLRESLMATMPEGSPKGPGPERLGRLVEQRADFASTCCPPNSPPLYCASKVSSELGEA
ncbi:PREDICTED: LOW QUALITY PROTEIN: vitamin D-binding protein [Apaloderma vittatum]|uniref:LOW QUALITY PROTEIN: vitamin D-binding protein n=1 Tax=Apaloderma vittatum TaxID=57397 RepID=UPI000521209D|nr:PREDICTED: LOW QUALITY PROTEIN: vitamin D-binding protein [Apaloderma vittatum]